MALCPVLVLDAHQDAGFRPGAVARPRAQPRTHRAIATWDKAIPLGNGLMGGLLWGAAPRSGCPLDRPTSGTRGPPKACAGAVHLRQLIKEGGGAGLQVHRPTCSTARIRDAHPSKIPAGRVGDRFLIRASVETFELISPRRKDEHTSRAARRAEGALQRGAARGAPADSRAAPRAARAADTRDGRRAGTSSAGPDSQGVRSWVIRRRCLAKNRPSSGTCRRRRSNALTSSCWARGEAATATLYAVAFTATMDDPDPLALAGAACGSAAVRLEMLRAPHTACGPASGANRGSSCRTPAILRQYYLASPFLPARRRAAAPRRCRSRACGPPDAGSLPPWKGDYHNDLKRR